MWQNHDELRVFFPVVEVEGKRYKAGTTPQQVPDELKEGKFQICLDITTLCIKKVNLINYILEEIPKCVEAENAIYSDLSQSIKNEKKL